MADVTAAERKRKRLEAWRKRQQQDHPSTTTTAAAAAAPPPPPPILPPVKITLSSKIVPKKKAKSVVPVNTFNVFGQVDDDDKDNADEQGELQRKPMLDLDADEDAASTMGNQEESYSTSSTNSRKRRRWDVEGVGDALDSFMEKLQDGAIGSVSALQDDAAVHVNVSGSMMRLDKSTTATSTTTTQPQSQQLLSPSLTSGQVVTAEQLALWNGQKMKKGSRCSLYTIGLGKRRCHKRSGYRRRRRGIGSSQVLESLAVSPSAKWHIRD
jgi:hypothetical protein